MEAADEQLARQYKQFTHIPFQSVFCPRVLETHVLPPEDFVKGRLPHQPLTYHYAPCPNDMLEAELSIPYLHSFYAPGPHLHNFWANLTPKKLHARLPDALDPATGGRPLVGWGVRIVERLNWCAWSVLTELLLVLGLVWAVLYAALRRDVSGGFAVAQNVVAALTMLNALIIAILLQRTQARNLPLANLNKSITKEGQSTGVLHVILVLPISLTRKRRRCSFELISCGK